MRVLRRNRHLLRGNTHASPTYGGWTTEEPTRCHLRGLPHDPARQGALTDK